MNLRTRLVGLSMIPMSMGFMLQTPAFPSIYAGHFQVQVQTPDGSYDLQPGQEQLLCPFTQFAFNEDVHRTKDGVNYTFRYRTGTRSSGNYAYSVFTFPDIIALEGGAAMRNPYVTAVCFRWYDMITATMTEHLAAIYYGGTILTLSSTTESSGPASPPQEQPGGGTSTTWCVFRNYWDSNGGFMYREMIPGSCWTVYHT